MSRPRKRRRVSRRGTSSSSSDIASIHVAEGFTLTDLDLDTFSEVLSYLEISQQFLVSLTSRRIRDSSLFCSNLGRLTSIASNLAELSPDSSTQDALRRVPGIAPSFPTVIALTTGDCFHEGHGKTETTTYICNLLPTEIEKAYADGVAKVGTDLNDAELCEFDPDLLEKITDLYYDDVSELCTKRTFRYAKNLFRKMERDSFVSSDQYLLFWWLYVGFGRPDVLFESKLCSTACGWEQMAKKSKGGGRRGRRKKTKNRLDQRTGTVMFEMYIGGMDLFGDY